MISERMVKELNEQINKELYSAYLYMAMSSYSSSEDLNGFANWFSLQAEEEVGHARKIYDYVNSQGGRVILSAIDEPGQDFKGPQDLFEKTLEHEKKVTAMINSLVKTAKEEDDYATEVFLQWFVSEQVEEEENAQGILSRVKMVGEKGNGLFMLDKELGGRKDGSEEEGE
jgi:ferritin